MDFEDIPAAEEEEVIYGQEEQVFGQQEEEQVFDQQEEFVEETYPEVPSYPPAAEEDVYSMPEPESYEEDALT